jgi:UDP-N-acetylmuramoyl-tripeptide--D-alanyl-D-alanine ligase
MKLRIGDLLRVPYQRAQHLDALREHVIGAIRIDSRSVTAGDVFVAFRGARVDAHDFVVDICARGALCCIVDQRWHRRNRTEVASLPLLVVRDTIEAYGAIAQWYRAQFDLPLIGVTGSNGKTSTKDMISAVLAGKYNVLATEGNYNNHIGLPATLLRMEEEHEVVVAEMGSNQPGDIAMLSAIARPTHGLVTNIGRAHIEKLRSPEGIAEEKAVLYASLPPDGTVFLNADEVLLRPLVPRGLQRIRFGMHRNSDIRITDITLGGDGCPRVRIEAPRFMRQAMILRLRVAGRHAAWNAAAALAVGFAFGCGKRSMKRALEGVESTGKRLQVRSIRGITILDDSYNANPDSMLAALDLLRQRKVDGARCVVLGDMLELGDTAREEHAAVGAVVASMDIPFVLTYGKHARTISSAVRDTAKVAMHFTDKAALCAALDALLDEGDTILVKGSRSMKMEDVVSHLLRNDERTEALA